MSNVIPFPKRKAENIADNRASFDTFLADLNTPKGVSLNYQWYRVTFETEEPLRVTSLTALDPQYITCYDSGCSLYIRDPAKEDEGYITWLAAVEVPDPDALNAGIAVLGFEETLPPEVQFSLANHTLCVGLC